MSILLFGDTSTWNIPDFSIAKINPEIRRKIKRADCVIYNLEGPIRESDKEYKLQLRENPLKHLFYKTLLKIKKAEQPIVSSGESILDLLTLNSHTVVTLANNHIKDLGREGFEDTIQMLEENDVGYVGAGKNGSEVSFRYDLAEDLVLYNFNLVSSEKWGIPFHLYDAGPGEYGAATLSVNELNKALAKDAGKHRLLLLHAGSEMGADQDDSGVDFDCISRMDLDLVAITHTHRYQRTEYEDDSIYVLGDFIFRHLEFPASRTGAYVEISESLNVEVRRYRLKEMYEEKWENRR